MTKTKKQVLVSLVITGIGFTGLMVGVQLHPDSNLLGGWGPVFGPVYWLGLLLLFLSGVRLLARWFVHGRTVGEAESSKTSKDDRPSQHPAAAAGTKIGDDRSANRIPE